MGNPAGLQTKRRMFDLFVKLKSKEGVARELNSSGLTSPGEALGVALKWDGCSNVNAIERYETCRSEQDGSGACFAVPAGGCDIKKTSVTSLKVATGVAKTSSSFLTIRTSYG